LATADCFLGGGGGTTGSRQGAVEGSSSREVVSEGRTVLLTGRHAADWPEAARRRRLRRRRGAWRTPYRQTVRGRPGRRTAGGTRICVWGAIGARDCGVGRGIDGEKVEGLGLASELRGWGCRRGWGGSPVSGGRLRERARRRSEKRGMRRRRGSI
jgi:hypothetical protein